jgi:hypothetical protein
VAGEGWPVKEGAGIAACCATPYRPLAGEGDFFFSLQPPTAGGVSLGDVDETRKSMALHVKRWFPALRGIHPENPSWRTGDISMQFDTTLPACGGVFAGLMHINPFSCTQVGAFHNTLIHEWWHFQTNRIGLGDAEYDLYEGIAVFGPYATTELEFLGDLDFFGGTNLPGVVPGDPTLPSLTRAWAGYGYSVLLSDREAVANEGRRRLDVGQSVVAGTLIGALIHGGINEMEPLVPAAARTPLTFPYTFGAAYGLLYDKLVMLDTCLFGGEHLWAVGRSFDYHGLWGDPEGADTNPYGRFHDDAGTESAPRPLAFENDEDLIELQGFVTSEDADVYALDVQQDNRYIIAVWPSEPGSSVVPLGDSVLTLSNRGGGGATFITENDDCGADNAHPRVTPNVGACALPGEPGFFLSRLDYRPDFSGTLYVRVAAKPTGGAGGFRLTVFRARPSGSTLASAASLALGSADFLLGTLTPDEPVAFVKVNVGTQFGLLNADGACETNFDFVVIGSDLTVTPLVAVPGGASLPIGPSVDTGIGADVPVDASSWIPLLASPSFPIAFVLQLELNATEPRDWILSWVPNGSDCPATRIDASDFTAPHPIPRATDGSVDPLFRTISDSLYGPGASGNGDDDYYSISLQEGEHVTAAVSSSGSFVLDVAGPELSEPGFFVPDPRNTCANGMCGTSTVACTTNADCDGPFVDGVYTPRRAGGTCVSPTTCAERGAIWSEKGELGFVAFHDGTYLFRVRALNPAFPTDYVLSVATHLPDEPAHADLP